jgi:phosphoglucomutase
VSSVQDRERAAPIGPAVDRVGEPTDFRFILAVSVKIGTASTPANRNAESIVDNSHREGRTRAPANNAPIGGLKVVAGSGWFAARSSGTENIYKIYAESFKDQSHLNAIVSEAEEIVTNALNSSNPRRGLAEGRQ